MAIAGVENQSAATSLTELRALQRDRQQQTEELEQRQATVATGRTGPAPETEETDGTTGVNTGENPFGVGAAQDDATQAGTPQTGGTGFGGGLADQSLGALIQATQQQNDQANADAVVTEAEDEASDEELQQQLTAGNATNSLAPGFNNGGANDPQSVSVVV